MIADEQRKAFEIWFKENRSSGYMPITKLGSYYLAEHESAWQAWQAAQQVKPLEFERQSDGTLLAKHPLGYYEVFRYEEKYRNRNDCTGFSFESHCYISKVTEIEEEAIEAANADFRKRVLSCLVNGGV